MIFSICNLCEFNPDIHTTLTHLKRKLKDTIQSYKREDYNHGKTQFRDEITQEIKDLENKIKVERSL